MLVRSYGEGNGIEVDHIAPGISLVAPNSLQQLVTSDDTSTIEHECLEQRIFTRCQLDLLPSASHTVAQQIDGKFIDRDHLVAQRAIRTAKQRTQASEQFFKGKGFAEVVIRASVKPFDTFWQLAKGRQHQHGGRSSFLAQRPDKLESVNARQHAIDD